MASLVRVLIKPSNVDTSEHFWNAFREYNTEVSASWVVRYCAANGNDWTPFGLIDLWRWAADNGHVGRFTLNSLAPDWLTLNEGVVTVKDEFVATLARFLKRSSEGAV